jgi:hypothetical protein
MLQANVSKGIEVKCWSRDPAEAFAKGVVWINDVPMAGRIGYGYRAFRPIHIPLGNLNE